MLAFAIIVSMVSFCAGIGAIIAVDSHMHGWRSLRNRSAAYSVLCAIFVCAAFAVRFT